MKLSVTIGVHKCSALVIDGYIQYFLDLNHRERSMVLGTGLESHYNSSVYIYFTYSDWDGLPFGNLFYTGCPSWKQPHAWDEV